MTTMPKQKGVLLPDEPRSPGGTSKETDTVIDYFLQAPAWKERLPEVEELAGRSALAALTVAEPDLPLERTELSLVLANDAFVKELNRDYRGKDKPTNVLSFPALEEDGLRQEGELVLGDVILALETCESEAAAQAKSLSDHVAHLTVHGVLHLLGYDHQDASDAREMERLEIEILARLGVADPYGEGA